MKPWSRIVQSPRRQRKKEESGPVLALAGGEPISPGGNPCFDVDVTIGIIVEFQKKKAALVGGLGSECFPIFLNGDGLHHIVVVNKCFYLILSSTIFHNAPNNAPKSFRCIFRQFPWHTRHSAKFFQGAITCLFDGNR
ncbi:MAG: hypothetical protein HQL74_14360 [Magnetococcales bacterium]|nr:hypothetical protein [Magnetococcales bacterium]